MERLSVDGRPPPKENQEQQNRNLNSRRPQISQNRKWNPPDPPIGPQFHESFMDQDGENQIEDEIHQLDTEPLATFLTKEEHDNAFLETRETLPGDTNDFRRGYQLAVLDTQRQISLRNGYFPVMKIREAGNKASTSKPKIDPPPRDNLKNVPEPKGKE